MYIKRFRYIKKILPLHSLQIPEMCHIVIDFINKLDNQRRSRDSVSMKFIEKASLLWPFLGYT